MPGIAGVALSQIDNVSPNLGQSYIIDSFMVVVFGGVGNLWGTLVGALSLGVANKFLEPYAGAVLGKILVLVFIILFIQKRPRGLFALKGRAVDSLTDFRPKQLWVGRLRWHCWRRPSLRSSWANLVTVIRRSRCMCRIIWSPCLASISPMRFWPSRWIWCGAIAVFSRWATARFSRWAATPWACI